MRRLCGAMPIYEYVCRKCDHAFEDLVFGDAKPACPACKAEEAARVLSVTNVGRSAPEPAASPCGRCGDPRGPGACAMD